LPPLVHESKIIQMSIRKKELLVRDCLVDFRMVECEAHVRKIESSL